MKVLTLGAGKVGCTMALDLAKSFNVTAVDSNEKNLSRLNSLNPKIETISADASKLSSKFIQPYDLVVSGVPGFLGFQTLEHLINSGVKNIVDISFMPEDHLLLDSLAKTKGVSAIVDAGLAPGLSNMFCGYLAEFQKPEKITILVGGVPKVRKWPFNYKAPFSFVDVMEEYTRPARIKLYGHTVTKEPLTGVELIDTEIGTLEAFYTDGVRSLLKTIPEVPSIIEKTLRYPGYAEYISLLKKTGFFDTEVKEVKGQKLAPFDMTSAVLDKVFYLSPDEEDIVVLEVTGETKQNSITYSLVDFYCTQTKLSAMSRTTGYSATACASLLLKGIHKDKGIFLMEHIGRSAENFDYVLKYLAERKVNIKKLTK